MSEIGIPLSEFNAPTIEFKEGNITFDFSDVATVVKEMHRIAQQLADAYLKEPGV